MFPLGFILLTLGAYLVDCAVTNRPPIKTLEQILADPTHMRDTLANSRGTGRESTFTSADDLAALYANLQAPAESVAGGGGIDDKFSTGTGDAISGLTESFGAVSPVAQKAVSLAVSQVGKPYRWAATGPNAYDCSGLMYWAYKHAGVTIPRTTALMLASPRLKKVTRSQLLPGDLVFPHVGHVFMYIGNNRVVEAPHTGQDVHITNLYAFMTARRVVQ